MADADLPPAPLPESIGRYHVVRLLGEGAMGRVLLTHDPVLDRDVAVKHLRADLSIPDEVRRGLVTRMRHEARAAARVMHPHLVTLHDMGEDEGVGLFLVFEYVEGPTLKQRGAEGRVPPAEAARIAHELGAALTTAHEAGILHRDIKPENVILSKKGAKVADFGIAKIPDSTLTHQGGLMGTPAYSAPETFRTSTFSPESDQFSLASTLYEAVSGQRAFPGDDAVAVAQRILHESAEPFAAGLGLPDEVDRVFARALSRKPRERFPSCEAFGRALAAALTGGSGAPSPAGSGAPGARHVPGAGAAGALGASAAAPVVSDLPSERKNSHIVLGVLAVLITGTLLVRTALKSAPEPPVPAAPASASAEAAPSAPPPRPRPPPIKTTSRPAAGAAASAGTASAAAPAPGDTSSDPAEPPAAASASASASAAPAPSATGTAAPDAGGSALGPSTVEAQPD